jgi:tetratricopeptide (TPR) repeat protein
MTRKKLWLSVALAALTSAVLPAMAQQTGSIHGHANDPTGATITNGIISLSTDGGHTAKYTFNTDANGDFKGSDVAPGSYTVSLREPNTPADKVLDQFQDVKVTAGADTAQNFDLSRPDYIKKLTPEQQKQLAEVKAANAGILKENAVVKNLNADLVKARADNQAKNFADADALMSRDVQAKPDASLLWVELGIAQKGEKKFDAAITSLQKAISLEAASKKPNLQVEGIAGDALGEAYGDSGHVPESVAAYDAATKADPSNAGMFYTNEAIVMNRNGHGDETVAAADKAIAADPNKAIAYYLKGQSLIQKATVDPKTQKIVAPPGCAEAYQKYLDLAPNGPFANDAKGVLASIGEKESTSYRAKRH